MSKYWITEIPTTITTPKNTLQFYSAAGKLSIAKPSWGDDNGVMRQGKTVVFDIAALMESDTDTLTAARDMFAAIVEQITERLDL